jgi:hypothetical protein
MDSHQIEKWDLDPHQSDKLEADPHRINATNWIRIRIRINLLMTIMMFGI